MNLTTAIFLVNRDVRAVQIQYHMSGDAPSNRPYTFKTLDPTIKEGDLVIVPQSAGYKYLIAKVTAVDVDIDYDSTIQYKWIAGKFDPTAYEDILKKEEQVIEVVRKAEFGRKRKELAAALRESVKDNLISLELATKD